MEKEVGERMSVNGVNGVNGLILPPGILPEPPEQVIEENIPEITIAHFRVEDIAVMWEMFKTIEELKKVMGSFGVQAQIKSLTDVVVTIRTEHPMLKEQQGIMVAMLMQGLVKLEMVLTRLFGFVEE